MRQGPKADAIAAEVVRRLNAKLSRRFDVNSDVARQAARRWTDARWDADLVWRALEIRTAELQGLGKGAYCVPQTLFNTKLAKHVEMADAGVTPESLEVNNPGYRQMRQGAFGGHSPEAHAEEAGKKF